MDPLSQHEQIIQDLFIELTALAGHVRVLAAIDKITDTKGKWYRHEIKDAILHLGKPGEDLMAYIGYGALGIPFKI